MKDTLLSPTSRTALALVALLLTGPCVLRAQIPQVEETDGSTSSKNPSAEKKEAFDDEPFGSVAVDFSSVSGVEFSDATTEFDFTGTGVSVELPFASLSYNVFEFDWQDAELLDIMGGAAEPWERIQSFSLEGSYFHQLSDKFHLMAGLGLSAAYEEQSKDSFSFNISAALLWEKSAKWKLMFGLGYSYHPKIDERFPLVPLIGAIWNEDTDRGFSASLGLPETALRYHFSPRSSLSLELGGEGLIARLADDSQAAAAGYLEFDRFDLGVYYAHRLGDWLEFKAGANYGFEGEIRTHNADGQRLSTRELEASTGFRVNLSAFF